MIVTCHQPDLLPYSGFWHKMATSDLMDLRIHDQFQTGGYQRRVRVRDQWMSVPVVGNPRHVPIRDVMVVHATARETLAKVLGGRYRGSRNWDDVGPWLLDLVAGARSDYLWQLNLHLILGVRDRLGITTPVSIAPPPHGRANARLVESLSCYGADVYLAGPGGRNYMGDCAEFDEAGIEVRWSRHAASTGDSIVSVLMDEEDPLATVLAVQPEAVGEAVPALRPTPLRPAAVLS